MGDNQWKSGITKVEPNKILLRGYRIDELMGKLSYAEIIYLTMKGELPGEAEGRMIDAILVSSVDHGVTPPSTLAAITTASTGTPINASIAAGVLAISRYHGGAIEDCMKFRNIGTQYEQETGEWFDSRAYSGSCRNTG